VALLCGGGGSSYVFLFLYMNTGLLGIRGQPNVELATAALFGANFFGYSWSGAIQPHLSP
jgi:hypothetical protein